MRHVRAQEPGGHIAGERHARLLAIEAAARNPAPCRHGRGAVLAPGSEPERTPQQKLATRHAPPAVAIGGPGLVLRAIGQSASLAERRSGIRAGSGEPDATNHDLRAPRAAEPVADRLYRLQPHCAAEARNPRPRHRAGVDDRPGGRAVGNLGPEGRRERERQRLAPLVMRVVQYRHRDRLRRLAGTEAQRPGHRLIVRARRRRAVGGRIAH